MSAEMNKVVLPPPPPPTNSNFALLFVLSRERLTGPNYIHWMHNLRLTLRYEDKEYALDEPIPELKNESTEEEITAYKKHVDDSNKVSCLMVAAMSSELQKSFENVWAYEMNLQLAEMFHQKAIRGTIRGRQVPNVM